MWGKTCFSGIHYSRFAKLYNKVPLVNISLMLALTNIDFSLGVVWGLKEDQHYLFPNTTEQSVQMFCWPRGEHILFTWAVFFSGFSLGVEPSCTIRPQRLPVIWACICVSVPVTWPLTSARLISLWGLPTHRNASKWIQDKKLDGKSCPELHMLRDFSPGLESSA